MNFLAPQLLLGLLLIPVAIGFYLWAQRRRSRYAVRFTNLALLSNLAPRRPSWRRHLPPVLYLGAIAALLIGLARPTMVVQVPREDATVILTMDVSGSMRATDVSPTTARRRPGIRPLVHRPAARERAGRGRRLRLRTGHAGQPDHRPGPDQGGHQQPDRPRRNGHGRRPHAGPRHRREDPEGRRTETPDASARARTPRPRPIRPRAPGRVRGAGAPAPTSRRTSRSSPRSCSPTGRTRSARRSRSTRRSGPRPSASRSTRSPSARPTAPSTSRTTSGRPSPSTSRRTPRRSSRSPRRPAGRRSTRRPRPSSRASTTTSSRGSATPSSGRK